jgi:MFS family permease
MLGTSCVPWLYRSFIGIGIYGLATVLFAYSGMFWFALLMLTLTGVGDTISSILRGTINQLQTPDELRGRMSSSINGIFTMSGPQLGQFEIGIVAAWLGSEMAALTGGLACLVILVTVAAIFPKVGRFRIQGEYDPQVIQAAVPISRDDGT